jgi:hypothetical protein
MSQPLNHIVLKGGRMILIYTGPLINETDGVGEYRAKHSDAF